MAVRRLINSCVISPITLRINSTDLSHGGLSEDVTIVTRVVNMSNRFVCDSFHIYHHSSFIIGVGYAT